MGFNKNTNLFPQICEIWFATTDQVQGYINNGESGTMPVLSHGTWEPLYFTSGTLQFINGKQEKTAHGSLFNYSVSIRYPGIDHKHLNPYQFASLSNHKWILCLLFDDGQSRIIGSLAQGMEFSWQENLSNKGFGLSWDMIDTRPSKNLSYLSQFFVNTDQYLVQRYETNIDYSLTADKSLQALGPRADKLEYKEGYLQYIE